MREKTNTRTTSMPRSNSNKNPVTRRARRDGEKVVPSTTRKPIWTTFSPSRRARLITGILLQSDRGIDVVRVSEFSRTRKIIAAVQSGPFLVEGNKCIRGLNDSQLARRTFAGIATNDRACLGVCSDVSLGQLANILATTPIVADSKIRRAMNLDGGSSSAFWFAREDGSAFSIAGRKPVRDFVAVVPK